MARIAYLLLCHKDPAAVVAQACRLTQAGDFVAIHFDGRSSAADFARIRAALADNRSVTFAARRHRCGWGEWSLVAATLELLEAAVPAFPEATHFYLISGDCMPTKTAEFAHAFLDASAADYIESRDFFTSDFIKTGIREERLIFRHFFNERRHKRLFYASMGLQRRLGLARRLPQDLAIQIGSQWWCLRRGTVEALLEFCRRRPEVQRFFRTTWIPDETFFQTLVRHLVPEAEIRSRSPTFLLFSDYGMPVTFYNDHYDLLVGQDCLFARKISPDATDLRTRLGDLYVATGVSFATSAEGGALHRFLTGKGRVGRRFAPRFWETETSIGAERNLLMVVCKKWHVAKRLVERVRAETNLPAVGYLFNEEEAGLPDLGGIQNRVEKRTRHRRAVMRLLFDHFGSDTLVCCLDPAMHDLMQDFAADRATTRILEIACQFSDDYLAGHAQRLGLAPAGGPQETLDRLLPTIRYDIAFESDRLRNAGFAHLARMSETASADENAIALSDFLAIPAERARRIAETPFLFAD